jgi:hypothetical protein
MNHHADRSPLFCDVALAERIERAEMQLIAASSAAAHRRRPDGKGFVIPISGGVASFAEADSPFNKVTGLGFAGTPPSWPQQAEPQPRLVPGPAGLRG